MHITLHYAKYKQPKRTKTHTQYYIAHLAVCSVLYAICSVLYAAICCMQSVYAICRVLFCCSENISRGNIEVLDQTLKL
jgi:hypothetical protein